MKSVKSTKMTASDVVRIKKQITSILQNHASVSPIQTCNLLPIKSLQGKLYEAHVLATVCEQLVLQEGLKISLVGGSKLILRQKGGQINKAYPYFQVWKGGVLFGELFTDIYFTTLSYQMRGAPAKKNSGDFHELDIALLKPKQSGIPQQTEVMLAIECKNTSIKKSIIREVLGFRRELSFYDIRTQHTNFSNFPIKQVHADPNSVHALYCSDSKISRYVDNCIQFGIVLIHHRI